MIDYEHYDIHKEQPNWKAIAVVNWVGLLSLVVAVFSYLLHGRDYLLFELALLIGFPFQLVGISITLHVLVMVPLLKRLLPQRKG